MNSGRNMNNIFLCDFYSFVRLISENKRLESTQLVVRYRFVQIVFVPETRMINLYQFKHILLQTNCKYF